MHLVRRTCSYGVGVIAQQSMFLDCSIILCFFTACCSLGIIYERSCQSRNETSFVAHNRQFLLAKSSCATITTAMQLAGDPVCLFAAGAPSVPMLMTFPGVVLYIERKRKRNDGFCGFAGGRIVCTQHKLNSHRFFRAIFYLLPFWSKTYSSKQQCSNATTQN